jgi:hypothetical protein
MDVWTMQMKLDHTDSEIWMNENNKDEYDKLDNINDIYKTLEFIKLKTKRIFSYG